MKKMFLIIACLLPLAAFAQTTLQEVPQGEDGVRSDSIPADGGLREVPIENPGAPIQMPFGQPSTPLDQSVQEPDAPDMNEFEQPKNEAPPPVPPVDKDKKAQIPGTPGGQVESSGGDSSFSMVTLRGLNKVTARASSIEAPIGGVVRFGTIEIIAHRCWQAAPEDQPENAALLEISEVKQGEAPSRIFLGWMFASSPALSSLEHPFYDVTVVKCGKIKD